MSKYPYTRLANAVIKVAPEESKSDFKIALESVLPGEGRLSDNPVVESDTPGNKFEPGDILFGKLRPYLAKAWVADKPGSFVGDFLRFTPKPGWDSRFLGYVLRSPEFIDRASAEAYGSKMPRIEWEQIKNYQIPAPLLVEQKRIADKLDRELAEIDEFIANQQQLNTILEERMKAELDFQLWENASNLFSLKRFIKYIDQGISPVAENSPTQIGEYGILKAGCTAGGIFNIEANKKLIPGTTTPDSTFICEGDLLVTHASGSASVVGSTALVPKIDRNLALSDKIFRLHLKENISPKYLQLVMSSPYFRRQLELETSGAAGLAKNTPLPYIFNLNLPHTKGRTRT